METSVVLSRKMGDFSITQRTQDGYFDGNALLTQWNSKNLKKKTVDDFLSLTNTKEFISEIEKTINLQSADNQHSDNIGKGDYQVVSKIKGRMTIKGRTQDKVWMHPFLFIDFAMWINPTFKVAVIRFVYDELIKQRNDAGDAYKEMCECVAKISEKKDISLNIQTTAKGLNFICFGAHEAMLRNKQDESAMKALVDLEKNIVNLVKDGFITHYSQLYNFLLKKYYEKSPKF